MTFPTWKYEKHFRKNGYTLIAGMDEVGMGCLAGPVVAAAVILAFEDAPDGINDSKLVPVKKRELLDIEIQKRAVGFSIGMAEVEEIDSINILQASRLAMLRAVQTLAIRPDYLLVDGRVTVDCELPQISIIRGDQISVSIAAASILAKVYRDRLMGEMDLKYPGYAFASHKGYGSKAHRLFLQEKGPCPLHRKSFTWTPV